MGKILDSSEEFQKIRKYIIEHRSSLTWEIFDLYQESLPSDSVEFFEKCLLMFSKGWLPQQPILLSDLKISSTENVVNQNETFKNASKFLPSLEDGPSSYTKVVGQLDNGKYRPAIFEDLPIYSLAKVDNTDFNFAKSTYFEALDCGETLAYEAARRKVLKESSGGWDDLVIRASIKDPFDLSERTVGVGISTLTIRKKPTGTASFFMHHRNEQKVASALGVYHVIPAGEFQPSGSGEQNFVRDMNFEFNILREYYEEMLGKTILEDELGHSSGYNNIPFFKEVLESEAVKFYYLGTALDPLNLKAEILTVAVWDSTAFDHFFKQALEVSSENAEGTVVVGVNNQGILFDYWNVFDYVSHKTLPAGRGCLGLAWKHRKLLGIKDDSSEPNGDPRRTERL